MVAKRRSYMRAFGSLAVGTCVVLVMSQGCAKKPAVPVASPPPPATAGPAPAAGTSPADKVQAPARDVAGPAAGQTVAPTTSAPAKPAAPSEFAAAPQLEDIHFDFDRYEIRRRDAKVLDGTVQWLKTNPTVFLLIEGHCDERGTTEYNMALGERRARVTMNFLVGQGIQASRMTTVTYGKERPLCSEKNERCWNKNRRAHFLVKPS
jgi:peptidoglycan-associated lipoprotein